MKHFDNELSLEKFKEKLHNTGTNITNQLLSDGEKAAQKAARCVCFTYTSLLTCLFSSSFSETNALLGPESLTATPLTAPTQLARQLKGAHHRRACAKPMTLKRPRPRPRRPRPNSRLWTPPIMEIPLLFGIIVLRVLHTRTYKALFANSQPNSYHVVMQCNARSMCSI